MTSWYVSLFIKSYMDVLFYKITQELPPANFYVDVLMHYWEHRGCFSQTLLHIDLCYPFQIWLPFVDTFSLCTVVFSAESLISFVMLCYVESFANFIIHAFLPFSLFSGWLLFWRFEESHCKELGCPPVMFYVIEKPKQDDPYICAIINCKITFNFEQDVYLLECNNPVSWP